MRGFVNSWAVVLIATSVIVLLSTALFVNVNMESLDVGYTVELARWIGDAAYKSAEAGNCDPNIFGKSVVKSTPTLHFSSSGKTRELEYEGKLMNAHIIYIKNYPPVVRFTDPLNGSSNNCTDTYTFQWWSCDVDGDSLNYTLYMDSTELGETNKSYMDVDCSVIEGEHTFNVTATDGELTGYNSIIAEFTTQASST